MRRSNRPEPYEVHREGAVNSRLAPAFTGLIAKRLADCARPDAGCDDNLDETTMRWSPRRHPPHAGPSPRPARERDFSRTFDESRSIPDQSLGEDLDRRQVAGTAAP